mmetsp:Transcript_99926/g.258348  ORF Transcript_99926/g.258348 Transcript_99926/m.258348 type:complete len:94 (+) Transcript_99926:79-360(+)
MKRSSGQQQWHYLPTPEIASVSAGMKFVSAFTSRKVFCEMESFRILPCVQMSRLEASSVNEEQTLRAIARVSQGVGQVQHQRYCLVCKYSAKC